MGEAARRKGLVEEARKKIGDEAAAIVAALETQLRQLQLQHQAFVFEVEGLRREVAIAKAAPAELRRDVLTFRGDLVMKAEQIEALGLRLEALQANRLRDLETIIGADAMKVEELEAELTEFQNMTFSQRLRWVCGLDWRRAGG